MITTETIIRVVLSQDCGFRYFSMENDANCTGKDYNCFTSNRTAMESLDLSMQRGIQLIIFSLLSQSLACSIIQKVPQSKAIEQIVLLSL